jgi:nucleotide-binding universal stress UspA family protein
MTAVQFARIAVATDGSPYASRALEIAIDLARRYGSSLTVLGVAPLVPMYIGSTEAWVPTEIPDTEIQHYRQLVDKSVAVARAAGLSNVTGVCLEGVIVDEIISYLEKSPADLLVMGSRGLSTARRLLLGSVSDAIVHHAKCPVLVVRPDGPMTP